MGRVRHDGHHDVVHPAFEIYELVDQPGVIKAVVTVANVAIVIYLVLRLRNDGNWPFRRP